MDREKLAEILSLVIDVKDEQGQPLAMSMQTAMIAALIERDGRIEAAKLQSLQINELACYIKDGFDALADACRPYLYPV